MTVLHLTTFLQGGAGRCIVDLALEQQASGLHPIVVTSASGETSGDQSYENYAEYLATLRRAGIQVHLLDSLFKRDLSRNLAVVAALTHDAGNAEVRLIHAHASTPALIGLLFAARASRTVPVVQTMHGWGIRKSPEQAAADLAVMRVLDAVVTTSHASRRLLAEMGLPDELIRVIPCGLAAEPPVLNRDDVSEELQLARSRGARVILCIGSVTTNKNQQLLVEALPTVSRQQPILCAFLGEGAGIGELSRLAENLHIAGSVRFLGHRPNAASYLAAADLLVAPSRTEGQGLAVLEAFRARVPVVASNTPALEELVSGPDLGLTFASESAEALAAAINRALALPASERETIVRRGWERFATGFTTNRMAAAHAELYRTLLAARGIGALSSNFRDPDLGQDSKRLEETE
jgi:glycosyltransferase involved in cell wall biosynthesis